MKILSVPYFLDSNRLLKKINKLSSNENIISEEREELIRMIHLLCERLSLPLPQQRYTRTFQCNKGVENLHRILRLTHGNRDIAEVIFRAFVLLFDNDRKLKKWYTAITIHLSGESIIKEIIELHYEDENMRAFGKAIIKELRESSSSASLGKINHMKRAVEYGMDITAYNKAFPNTICRDKDAAQESIVILVLTEMEKHLDTAEIQLNGLQVLHNLLSSSKDCCSEFFGNVKSIPIFIAAITSKNVEMQRHALTILLLLTEKQHICERLSKADDASCLLQLLVQDQTFPQKLKQILLWTLTNLTAEGENSISFSL